MNRRHSLALVAGAATIMASLPLWSVFKNTTWLFYAVICVALVIGTAMLVRALRGPAWAQVLAMLGTLLLFLTWLFPSGGEIAAVIPTLETFRHFNTLLGEAGQDIREQAVPVPDLDGVMLLTTAGIGLVALLVDLTAVGIRRPALAGLPMLAIYSVPVAVLPGGVNLLTFALAGAGYMWLLVSDSVDRVRRFGRRFSGEGRDVDLWEPSPLSAAGRRLGLVGIVFAILIPLAVPGMTSGFLDRFGTGTGGGGQGGGAGNTVATVDMRTYLYDNLIRTERFDMVRLRTNDPDRYYLRIGVADQPDNDGFKATLPTGGTPVNRELPTFAPPTKGGITSRKYQAEVEVVGLDLTYAPVYQQLVSIGGLDASWSFDDSTNQVFTRRSNVRDKRYSFEYVRMNYTSSALRTAGSIPPSDPGARQLVRIPTNTYVKDLVDGLTQGKITEYDKVRAIYDYFGTGFTYSFNSPPGDSGSPIQDFLTNKQGFCVQYATAMAWMVRQAGYPARVAFGFTKGESNGNGEVTLTNYNLHAWTEVYFTDFGWVPFDATPASSISGSSRPSWAPDNTQATPDDPSATPGSEASAQPGGSAGPDPRDPRLPEDNGLIPQGSERGLSPWWFIGAAVAAVILLIALLLPSARRRALRRSRRARSGTIIELGPAPPTLAATADLITDPAAVDAARRDAHGAWEELIDTMVDYGVDVDPSETPRATAERLAGLSQLARPGRAEAAVVARAEERARYARTPIRADRLNEAVRTVRSSFAERATRTERFMATVFPRSVINRWRIGWVDFLSRSSNFGAQVRDTLMTISPRRLITRTSTR